MKKYAVFLWLCPFIYFILFGWMDWLPLKKYDEARMAINAVEMCQNHNYLVSHFEGKPEMWQTKPLLLVWLQSISIKLFGINEVATRLPVALAALAICFLLYYSCLKWTNEVWIGIFAILILITSKGFVNMHGARSGDFDVLLALFTFINALSFYKYVETERNKYLYLFFISFILEVYTKSIQGLIFYPAYLIYLIWQNKMTKAITPKIIIGFAISFLVILTYYILRERVNPNYIQTVVNYEIFSHYVDSVEGHQHPFYFYFQHIIGERFQPWFFVFLVGLFYPYKDIHLSRFIRYLGILIFSYLLFISIAQTKLIWYDIPLYPFMSIIAALGTYQILKPIYHANKIYTGIIFFIVFGAKYLTMFQECCYIPRISDWEKEDYKLTYFLRDKSNVIKKYKDINVIWEKYNVQNIFYIYALKEKKKDIQYNGEKKSGQTCIFYQENIKRELDSNFQCIKLLEVDGVYVYKLI